VETFVIRLWEPSDADAPPEIRGKVRCIRTGVEAAFRNAVELLDFIDANRRSRDGLAP
jgi:hypothetical protein